MNVDDKFNQGQIVRKEKKERNRQRREKVRELDSADTEELKRRLGKREFNRQVGIIEDFYSTRAVAHASFFVASVFGLFTILTLMEVLLEKLNSNGSEANFTIISLSLVYWGAFGFGLYSFMNFGHYSNLAKTAIWKTAREADALIKQSDIHKRVFGKQRNFSSLKSWLAEHNNILFLGAYCIGSLLVFVTFVLCH